MFVANIRFVKCEADGLFIYAGYPFGALTPFISTPQLLIPRGRAADAYKLQHLLKLVVLN